MPDRMHGAGSPSSVVIATTAAWMSSTEWQALIHDAGADVAVMNTDGQIVWVCPDVRWWPIVDPSKATGRMLHEVFDPAMARERLDYARRAAQYGHPVVVVSMWKGVGTRTTYRPIEIPGVAGRLILAVCRPVAEADAALPPAPGAIVVQARHADQGPLANLTPRELEVLSLIGEGMTTEQIAKKLFRSRKTIEAHRLALGLKLNVRNRVELARIAIRAGLVKGERTEEAEGESTEAMPTGAVATRSAPGEGEGAA